PLPLFCSLLLLPPPLSTLFPYTTLFRSEVVGNEQDRRAVLLLELGDEPQNLLLHGDVERRCRLVGDDQARLGREGRRDQHALTQDRKRTRLNSSHVKISYAVFCLKKKRK